MRRGTSKPLGDVQPYGLPSIGLGYAPSHRLGEGLAITIPWYTANLA